MDLCQRREVADQKKGRAAAAAGQPFKPPPVLDTWFPIVAKGILTSVDDMARPVPLPDVTDHLTQAFKKSLTEDLSWLNDDDSARVFSPGRQQIQATNVKCLEEVDQESLLASLMEECADAAPPPPVQLDWGASAPAAGAQRPPKEQVNQEMDQQKKKMGGTGRPPYGSGMAGVTDVRKRSHTNDEVSKTNIWGPHLSTTYVTCDLNPNTLLPTHEKNHTSPMAKNITTSPFSPSCSRLTLKAHREASAPNNLNPASKLRTRACSTPLSQTLLTLLALLLAPVWYRAGQLHYAKIIISIYIFMLNKLTSNIMPSDRKPSPN